MGVCDTGVQTGQFLVAAQEGDAPVRISSVTRGSSNAGPGGRRGVNQFLGGSPCVDGAGQVLRFRGWVQLEFARQRFPAAQERLSSRFAVAQRVVGQHHHSKRFLGQRVDQQGGLPVAQGDEIVPGEQAVVGDEEMGASHPPAVELAGGMSPGRVRLILEQEAVG